VFARPQAIALLLAVSSALVHPAPGILHIRNDRFDAVEVEVRLGPSAPCDQHPAGAVRTLRRGQVWGVVSGQVICWRRARIPGNASSGWTAWEQLQVASDSTRTATL